MILSPPPTDLAAARLRTVRRYRGVGRFDRGYVAGKLRHDPVYADLLARTEHGFGQVLDVGCGRGQLGVLLLEAGAATSVIALDRNAAHLAQARTAADTLPFSAVQRDLAHDQSLPPADTVFLIDVLYQLDTQVQRALLAAATLAARSRVVIRTSDPTLGLRAAATLALEMLGRNVWPHAGKRVNPQPVAAIAGTLAAAGFKVTEAPCWRGTPYANILLIGQR